MTRADLLSLAARCESAAGPDRALDEAIARAMGWKCTATVNGWYAPEHAAEAKRRKRGIWLYPRVGLPAFTASIDTALPNEAEGYWTITGPRRYLSIPTPAPNVWLAEFMPWRGEPVKAWAATEALARRAAALRARAEGVDDA
jgi:hypothetical protein